VSTPDPATEDVPLPREVHAWLTRLSETELSGPYTEAAARQAVRRAMTQAELLQTDVPARHGKLGLAWNFAGAWGLMQRRGLRFIVAAAAILLGTGVSLAALGAGTWVKQMVTRWGLSADGPSAAKMGDPGAQTPLVPKPLVRQLPPLPNAEATQADGAPPEPATVSKTNEVQQRGDSQKGNTLVAAASLAEPDLLARANELRRRGEKHEAVDVYLQVMRKFPRSSAT
jgi:hypothetical protein